MPLKHFEETVLIVILAGVMLLTGLLLPTLPLLPQGLVPMLILLGLTFLYPLALLPMLRANRADYPFRLLHFFPALMVLVWTALQLLTLWKPQMAVLTDWYTWGWALGAVLLGFFLLMLFCVSVLRRWVPRLTILSAVLVPFVALAIASGLLFRWERSLASALWMGDWWNVMGGEASFAGKPIAMNPEKTPDEKWKEKLNGYEKSSAAASQGRVAAIILNPKEEKKAASSAPKREYVPSVTPSPETHLPKSGPITETLPVLFLAGWATAVQVRARRRMVMAIA